MSESISKASSGATFSNLDRVESSVQDALKMTNPDDQVLFHDGECRDQPDLHAAVETRLNPRDVPIPPTPTTASQVPKGQALAEWETTIKRPVVIARPGVSWDESTVTVPQPGDSTLVEPTTSGNPVDGLIAERYRLLEILGTGGMGEVWKAEQLRPVRRLVALKLVKSTTQTETVLARFEAERQALAMMDHPHVAKVLDAGTTAQGAPFFVMEYVDGLSLTEYCDSRKLSIPQRLELFVTICAAVQHAHHKGIVHRDLKPSNILVAESDGKPAVKVIDFGLVKALNDPNLLTDDTIHTHAGVMLGTLLYMSPEQARAVNPHDVDTRADVYSLGVILYELLTGTTPIERGRLGPLPLEERRRIIIEEEPSRPSARLRGWDSLCEAASSRGIEPSRLGSILKGDLDWVVMKALEKERHHRYETVNALSRDVQRFLANEPVEARPPSGTYRLKKFARRYRLQVTALALVLATLVVGMVGIIYGLVVARQARDAEAKQRQIAEQEKTNAKREAATAVAVKEFVLRDMLSLAEARVQARARVKVDPDLKVRDVLLRAAQRIEGKFAEQPLVEAEVRLTLGNALCGIGRAREAIVQLERSHTIRKELLGDDHLSTLNALSDLGVAYEKAGQASQAIPIFEQVLERRRGKLGENHPQFIMSISNLAWCLDAVGDTAKAINYQEQAVTNIRLEKGKNHPATLKLMNNLAVFYQNAGDYSKALDLFEQVMIGRREQLGEDHPETLESINSLASVYLLNYQIQKSILHYKQAFTMMRSRLGEDHPDTLSSLSGLAAAHESAGEVFKAIPLLERVLEGRRIRLGTDHPDTLRSLSSLAAAYERGGEMAKALPLYQQAFEMMRVKLSEDHPSTLLSLNNLAFAYKKAGDTAKAIPLYEQCLEKQRAKLGADHPNTLNTLNNLASAYDSSGDTAKAIPLYEQCLEKQRAKLGADHPDTLTTLNNLARAYESAGDVGKAIPLYEQCLEKQRAKLGADHPDTLISLNNLAMALLMLDEIIQAKSLLTQGLETSRVKLGENHPIALTFLNNLAKAYAQTGDAIQAIPLFEQVLETSRVKLGADHPNTLTTLSNLAFAHNEAGHIQMSVSLYDEALQGKRTKLGEDHPSTLITLKGLAGAHAAAGALDQAALCYEEAFRKLGQRFGSDHPMTLETLLSLARIYRQSDRFGEAIELVNPVIERLRSGQPRNRRLLENGLNTLGWALLETGKPAEAEPILRECLKLNQELAPDSKWVALTQTLLGQALLDQGKLVDALPLLTQGEEGLRTQRQPVRPGSKSQWVQSARRLARLYEAMEFPEEAALWRAEADARLTHLETNRPQP